MSVSTHIIPELRHINTVSQLFEVIDWSLDGNGLTITDGRMVARAIADRFTELEWDMTFPYDENEELDAPDIEQKEV